MHALLRAALVGAIVCSNACTHAPDKQAQAYSVQHNFELGGEGRWDLLAVDPALGHVFLSRSDRVEIVDGNSGKPVGAIPGTDGVHGIAIAASLGRGYTSNGRSNTVTEFDLKTLERLREIKLSGQSPDAIVYDETSGRLNAHSNNVSVIDPASGSEIALIGFEGNPELAVADHLGHLFVNIEDKAQLVEIDTRANAIMNTWPLAACEGPTGLAMDIRHQRLFSACDNQLMVVTDAASGRQVAQLAIGEGPDGAVFDAGSQDAFAANGKSGTVTVVH